MILLIILLNLIDPFTAEVKQYRGDELVRQDTTLVYYRTKDEIFYITWGSEHFSGEVLGNDRTFTVVLTGNIRWKVSIISPTHLILINGNRTVTIRGV